jgi:hypothetical protein
VSRPSLVAELLTDVSTGADALRALEGRRLTTEQLNRLVGYVAQFLDAAEKLGVSRRKPTTEPKQ